MRLKTPALACAVAAFAGCVGARATDVAVTAPPTPRVTAPAAGASTPSPPTGPGSPSRAPEGRSFRLRPAPWSAALDALIGDRPASVSVAIHGRLRFSHLGDVPRIPASNEKLLLSMALLDRFGARHRIPTTAEAARPVRRGVVRGNLWLVGHGDPEVDATSIARLAARLRGAGVRRVRGSIVGDTSTFRRERTAPGWHPIALSFIGVPTALTFEANVGADGFVFDPERDAAGALTADLRALGVEVEGRPRAGAVVDAARPVARVRSAPLSAILRRQNVSSLNLDAEVLSKMLGAAEFGGRGTIAKGARAIEAWTEDRGADVVAHDASGLSYADRIGTDDMVRLLVSADRSPWGDVLRSTLAAPGEGTLGDRFGGLDVRAKTGTLIREVSALSGWVVAASGRRAAFSILSRGLPKAEAVALEDAVVRFLAARA